MRSDLPRLIYRSASQLISTRAGIITHYEGGDRLQDEQEGVEFRTDGPRFTEISRGYFKIWYAINLLIQHTMDGNLHTKHTMAGTLVDALNIDIPILDDDDSEIGCLNLMQDEFNRLQVNQFGQIGKTIRLEQSTVEAHYQMYYTEN